jgi:hypothetical protein
VCEITRQSGDSSTKICLGDFRVIDLVICLCFFLVCEGDLDEDQ